MNVALDVLVVVAARVPTESLLALATGSDAAHAPLWAFEVTGDVISAGEPGGHMSVRKITGGTKLILRTRNCLDNCDNADRQAGDLDKLLKALIIELKKVDWPEADEEDASLQNDGAQG